MKTQQRAQYQISVDGVPRRYCDRQDIALQTARFLKSRNPNGTITLSFGRITSVLHFRREKPQEQIWNAT